MYERSFNSNSYAYGHNGQEKDDEIFQGAYTAEFWEYDSRTLRRWNRDPVVKEWESSYACFSNNPITNVDINGDSDDKVVKSNPNNPNSKGGKEKFHNETKKLVTQNLKIQEKSEMMAPINMTSLSMPSNGDADLQLSQSHLGTKSGGNTAEFYVNKTNFNYESKNFGSTVNFNNFTGEAHNNSGVGKIDYGASYYSAFADADVRLGPKDYNIGGQANGSLFSARANITMQNKYHNGVLFDANAGAYVAEGEVSGSLTLFGAKLKVTAGGSAASAHAGISFGIYYDDKSKSIIFKGAEHLGLGFGAKGAYQLEIPINK